MRAVSCVLVLAAIVGQAQPASGQQSEPERVYALGTVLLDQGIFGPLYSLSTEDGSWEFIGETGIVRPRGLELYVDGYLYGQTGASVYRIDPHTAETTLVGTMDFTDTPNINNVETGGVALAPTGELFISNGLFFVGFRASFYYLLTLDLESLLATEIGPFTSAQPNTSSLGFNCFAFTSDGILFGRSDTFQFIDYAVVDAQTAQMSPVLGQGGTGTVMGMTTVGGRLYLTQEGPVEGLYRVELSGEEAVETLVGPGPFEGVPGQGLAGLAPRSKLVVDVDEVSLSAGGVQHFRFAAPEAPGQFYFVLGSVSGTQPGVEREGHLIPLNRDFYWDATRPGSGHRNPLVRGVGKLDERGLGTAELRVRSGSNPGLAGITVHHVVVVLNADGSMRHVTNAVPLALTD